MSFLLLLLALAIPGPECDVESKRITIEMLADEGPLDACDEGWTGTWCDQRVPAVHARRTPLTALLGAVTDPALKKDLLVELRAGPYLEVCPGHENAIFIPWTTQHRHLTIKGPKFESRDGVVEECSPADRSFIVEVETETSHVRCDYDGIDAALKAWNTMVMRAHLLQDRLGHRHAYRDESHVMEMWRRRDEPDVRAIAKGMNRFPHVQDVWREGTFEAKEELAEANDVVEQARWVLHQREERRDEIECRLFPQRC